VYEEIRSDLSVFRLAAVRRAAPGAFAPRRGASCHGREQLRHPPLWPGEILPLTFKSTTPIVEAAVRLPDQSEVKAQLEVDTGCDGALCLGKHFVEAHQLAPTNNPARTAGRVGVGGSTRTRAGHLPQLRLGRVTIEKPSANLFLEGSPSDPPLAGHIGWELLRDFKVILDYSRKRMILEPMR
jgi:predicted aspartyl protease